MDYIEPQTYHKLYAKRHNIPVLCIIQNEKLEYASLIEFLVGTQKLSLVEGRRMFVDNFPKHNNITSKVTTIDQAGRKKEVVKNISVMVMIQPYPDSIIGIKNLKHPQD